MGRALLLMLGLMLAACDAAPENPAQPPEIENAVEENAIDVSDTGNVAIESNLAEAVDTAEDVAAVDDFDAGDVIDAGVEPGRGAFLRPEDMEIGHWYTIEFLVGPDENAVAQEAEGMPITEARPVFVSSSMRVTLLDDGNFEIRPKRDALQQTGADKTASWQWNVRPLTDGDHSLHARIEILKRKPDGSYETLDDYTRRVSVRVRVGTWEGFLNALRNAATLGDVLGTLFRSWEKTLLALGALLIAGFGVRRIIQARGK